MQNRIRKNFRHIETAVAPRGLASRQKRFDTPDQRIIPRRLKRNSETGQHRDVHFVVEHCRKTDSRPDQINAGKQKAIRRFPVQTRGKIRRGGMYQSRRLQRKKTQLIDGVLPLRRHPSDTEIRHLMKPFHLHPNMA